MNNEIDSSNIIAVLANSENNIGKDKCVIAYRCIRKIAEGLEERIPTLHATYDMISIDAFRCYLPNYVEMEENELIINNLKEIHYLLKNLEPSESITELINEISKKI